jgi:hypothetical protein
MTMTKDPWQSALPIASAEKVVQNLLDTFQALRQENSATFHFGMHEDKLSKRLANRLQNTEASGDGPVGFWNFEQHTNTKNEDDPRRLDITFSTTVDNATAVQYVFECKKMAAEGHAAKRHRAEYLKYGVRRFVQGSYAPKTPLGFLVAFAEGESKAYVTALKRLLTTKDLDVTLGLTKQDNRYWREPPQYFGKQAALSTLHQRVNAPAGVLPEIVLFHIPLMIQVWSEA